MSEPAERRQNAPAPHEAPVRAQRHAALDDTRKSFLRMVSHELRTPLNSIIGFSEILAQELYGPLGAPQYREYAAIVRESGVRLLRLVNQVLEIAKLEADAGEVQIGVEAVDSALDDAVDEVRADAERVGVALEVDAGPPGLAALADGRALRSALGHLLQNAVAHAPTGGTVRVKAAGRGPLVVIEIADAGQGLDPNDVPRLMLPFEQGQNALTRTVEGAGLGWPIVSLLCRAMGGEFKVETAPGEGLTASVVLRRASA